MQTTTRTSSTSHRFAPLLIGLTLIAGALGACSGSDSRQEKREVQAAASSPGMIERTLTRDLGDYPDLLEKRRLRVLVPWERPYFFIDQGQASGITFEMFREYAKFIEKEEGLRSGDLGVVYVPCELNDILPKLRDGYGDIAASGLTVTPERETQVAFSKPLVSEVSEILVTGPGSPKLTSLDDLAGQSLMVAAGSSYVEHLRELDEDFQKRGLEAIDIREAPNTLTTDNLLEMVNAGIVSMTVCDDYKAELWSQVLDDLELHEDLVVHTGGSLAWAVRSENPDLLEKLNEFVGQAKRGTLLGNILIKRYFESTRWIENPNDSSSKERIERYAGWIQELADEFDFDWVRIAAQCFQESKLDPDAVSSAGAIGLLQLLPSTAKDMGCEDLNDPKANLRAGVKYLDWLRANFFADPELGDDERMDLILAAYNAGPGNVRKWRKLAPERGLDPDKWRGHVELLALEDVGVQPVRYVQNIESYYVAYTLALDLADRRESVSTDE